MGQRKFDIILAQLRVNYSNLNAHLYSIHVIDSPACGCSHREDTAHFFLDCPLYYAHRLSLTNIVTKSSQFKLEPLLYGDDDLDYESNVAIILAAILDFTLISWLFFKYIVRNEFLTSKYPAIDRTAYDCKPTRSISTLKLIQLICSFSTFAEYAPKDA